MSRKFGLISYVFLSDSPSFVLLSSLEGHLPQPSTMSSVDTLTSSPLLSLR